MYSNTHSVQVRIKTLASERSICKCRYIDILCGVYCVCVYIYIYTHPVVKAEGGDDCEEERERERERELE